MNEKHDVDAEIYLRGEKLIGDDYTNEEIQRWFLEEEEGYANLGAKSRESYSYVYHALNKLHGFSALPNQRISHALGLGSAYGDEFLPLINRIDKITILDPSDQLKVKEVGGVHVEYERPCATGKIGFADDSFDLITCLGVLHHVPNVTYVISEMGRVLRSGGYALIREPAIGMGDWRKPRPGLTANERGIPELIMRDAIEAADLHVVSRAYCDFAPIAKLGKIFGIRAVYNSPFLTRLDALASQVFAWNIHYQSKSTLHKIAPASVFWVCEKRSDGNVR